MENRAKNKMETRLDSREWYLVDEDGVGYCFEELGIERVGEILGLRMFDLFNMDRIDVIRAWEMAHALYRFLNCNEEVDFRMELKIMDQYFPFKEWRKEHKPKDVRVVDLVMAFDMNKKALEKLFDEIKRAFFKSDEYNSRYYRYGDLDELKDADKNYKEITHYGKQS